MCLTVLVAMPLHTYALNPYADKQQRIQRWLCQKVCVK